ncbi:MAG TPA: HEAT repeat domain-containing protein [Bacteroidota bacterium]|nr:HEAT repeat domain-containing protein [Bacteroidota bacterium]
MKHDQFKEWLSLSAVGELTPDEEDLLNIHLRSCAECREELAAIKKFTSAIAGHRPVEVTDLMLEEARTQLRKILLERHLRHRAFDTALDAVRDFFVREYRFALGGIALTLLGVLVGYSLFSRPEKTEEKPIAVEHPYVQQAKQTGTDDESFTQGNTRTSNVRMMNSNAGDGMIEFTFDAVTPMHVRGNINDEKIQKVLARALTTEDNPGVRLRTVSAIASQAHDQQAPDPAVKTALISALKGDDNPGVRQEAMRALLRYPFDGEIRDALVYTLMHDKNSGMRIAAINGLAVASVDGHHMDQDVLDMLRHKIESDQNNYVRRQARTVIEEVTHR